MLSNHLEKSINSSDKNNLSIGTLLQQADFDTPRFVVADQLGISNRFPMQGMRYMILNVDTLELCVKYASDLKWINGKNDSRTQTYILSDTLPEDHVKVLYKKAISYKEEKERIQKQTTEKYKNKLNLGRYLFEQVKPDQAKAVIIASREIDDCVIMTERLSIKEEPFFIIGWSMHTITLFSELRKAAALSGMPELIHFSENNREDEHREKYWVNEECYYLKRGGRYTTAWKVSKQSINCCLELIYSAFADGRVRLNAPK